MRKLFIILVLCSGALTALAQRARYDALNVQTDYSIMLEGERMEREAVERMSQIIREEREREYAKQRARIASKEKEEAQRLYSAKRNVQKYQEYYESFHSYPISVPDGRYDVVILEEQIGDGVIECRAYVESNKVKRLYFGQYEQVVAQVISSFPISKDFVLAKVELNGSQGQFQVYFLDFIAETQRD